MNGIREVVSACSRVAGSRIEAQLLSRGPICSMVCSSGRPATLAGGVRCTTTGFRPCGSGAQPAAGDELEGDQHRDGLHQQQADQHQQLHGGRLQRGGAAEQHPDERARQGDQPDGPGLVQARHQGQRGVVPGDQQGARRGRPGRWTAPPRTRPAGSAARPATGLPAIVVAVIAPPTRIPTTGTTAMVWRGTSPLSTRPAETGTAAARTGAKAHHHGPPRTSRRPAVTEATVSITATKARVSGQDRRTAAMTSPTTRELDGGARGGDEVVAGVPEAAPAVQRRGQPGADDHDDARGARGPRCPPR